MATVFSSASQSRRLLPTLTISKRRFVDSHSPFSLLATSRRGLWSQPGNDYSSGTGCVDHSSRPRRKDLPSGRDRQYEPSKATTRIRRCNVSDWGGVRGHDLLADQQQMQSAGPFFYDPPKIVLHGYGPTGFDVGNALKNVQSDTERDATSKISHQQSKTSGGAGDGTLHMNGSILAFPKACFLWNVKGVHDVTMSSLSSVLLHQKPSRIEYLFLGINPSQAHEDGIDARLHPNLQKIQNVMYKQHNVVVEVMDLLNAIGTFNVLNAEDRMVATALLLDPTTTDEGENE